MLLADAARRDLQLASDRSMVIQLIWPVDIICTDIAIITICSMTPLGSPTQMFDGSPPSVLPEGAGRGEILMRSPSLEGGENKGSPIARLQRESAGSN